MAIQDLMTWEPRKDRWRKIYKGKLYTVSCYRLGVPPVIPGPVSVTHPGSPILTVTG